MAVNITVDKNNLQDVVAGPGSFLVFKENDRRQGSGAVARRPSDLENFYRIKQGLINTSIQAQAPGIQIPQIPVGRAAFPSQQGPISVTGTFTKTSAPIFDEFYWRNLIFSRQPAVTAVTNTATPIVAATTVGDGSHTFTAVPPATPTLLRSDPIGKVEVTLDAADAGMVTVVGTDRNGNEIQSTVSGFTGADLDKVTDDWFRSVSGFTTMGVDSTRTVKLDYTTDGYQKLNVAAGTSFLNGITIAQVIGGVDGVVDTFWDCFFQSVNFSFSREGSIDETWTVVGREASLGISPTQSKARAFIAEVDSSTALGSSPNVAFMDSSQNAITGWQAGIKFNRSNTQPDGLGLALIDATITANANVNFTPRVGQRPPGVPYKRTSDITLNFTTEYHSQYDDLVQAQLDARTMDNVQIEMIFRQAGQFPYRKAISFAKLEFTGPITRVIDSDDFVRLTGEARALPSTLSATDDIHYEAEFEDTDEWAGLQTEADAAITTANPGGDDPEGGLLRYYAN